MILELTAPRAPASSLQAARVVSISLALFALAAFFEIASCFALWIWVRRGAAPFVVVLGVASLVGFALALTRVDSAFYAAYGGIYIAAPPVWLSAVEGQSPSRTDLVGAALVEFPGIGGQYFNLEEEVDGCPRR